MIVVDSSVWIDHLRVRNERLVARLEGAEVLGHPWILGELALGNLTSRAEFLAAMSRLPQATLASAEEILTAIDSLGLSGLGLGYVDVQLLASTRLTSGARLWTRDRRLRATAENLAIAFDG